MKILYISGENEYGASNFDRSDHTVEEVWKAANDYPEERFAFDDDDFFAIAAEFGDIDPEFIDMAYAMLGEDLRTHNDFYIVDEEKLLMITNER